MIFAVDESCDRISGFDAINLWKRFEVEARLEVAIIRY